MRVGVIRESMAGETRVALVPSSVARLTAAGHAVLVESGAGLAALHPDQEYAQAGAEIVDGRPQADCLVCIHLPEQWDSGVLAVGLQGPRPGLSAGRALCLERLPRISRAQAMDVLSSQATVAGYKAVLLGAAAMPRFLPMLTTAAGTIRPARVLVMGVGVAGLTAISTAHRLGALVFGHDVRPETDEQVRSLGATFLGSDLGLSDKDLILTCAQVPGATAPILLTREAAAELRPGTVVVDLAADRGGNCEQGETWSQVTYLAPPNLPALLPVDASQMYSRNMEALIGHLAGVERLEEDELLAPMLAGKILAGA